MADVLSNIIYSQNKKLYTGVTKESIRADIGAMTFTSEKEREKAYNKRIKLFDYANSLVPEEIDDAISEKEIEVYNKKEKAKKIWKTIGLVTAGVGIVVTAFLIKKHLDSDIIKTKLLKKDTVEALKLYQTDEGAYLINSRLRNSTSLSESEIKEADTAIEAIRKGMNKSKIIKSLRAFRGEDFSFIQSQDKEISLRLKKAFVHSDKQEIQKILEEIKNQPLIQKSFMSTTLAPSQSFGGQVQWIFDVSKGKKAIYINPELGFKSGEQELLLSENSVVSIKDMQIMEDTVRGKFLQISASVS